YLPQSYACNEVGATTTRALPHPSRASVLGRCPPFFPHGGRCESDVGLWRLAGIPADAQPGAVLALRRGEGEEKLGIPFADLMDVDCREMTVRLACDSRQIHGGLFVLEKPQTTVAVDVDQGHRERDPGRDVVLAAVGHEDAADPAEPETREGRDPPVEG